MMKMIVPVMSSTVDTSIAMKMSLWLSITSSSV